MEQQKAIKAELNMVKSAFYCALCDKQYERISDYEVHLSSYDHNHKKVSEYPCTPSIKDDTSDCSNESFSGMPLFSTESISELGSFLSLSS